MGLSRRSQVPSAGLQNDQAGSVIHSAVSLCEGALGMLKAALAANKGPADELEHHVGSQVGRQVPPSLVNPDALHSDDRRRLYSKSYLFIAAWQASICIAACWRLA